MANENGSVAEQDRLAEALFACLQAVEAGESPPEVRARYPEFAAEVAEFLADREGFEDLAAPLRAAVRAAPTWPAHVDQTVGPVHEAAPALEARWLGDYELLEEVGRGGMGVVYKARHKRLNRLVALKVIRSTDLASAEEVLRFRNEGETLAALDHPHLVPVYEVGEFDGHLCLALKLIEGGGLDQRLASFREDPCAAARLVATVARAIHHAHQRGVLHRDLKPSNILLDAEGHPHVTDFGLAKRATTDSDLTQSGALVGTPSYMAPEQTSGKKGSVTTATDVHGLGAVLYALLTGRPAFRAETVLETLAQVREKEAEPPRRINPKVDRDLETICLKCLQKEPSKRYGSAQAVAEDLQSWLAGEPIKARPISPMHRAWRWCRRNPIIAGLLTLLSVVLVLLVAGLAVSTAVIWKAMGEKEEARAEAQSNYKRAEAQRRKAAGAAAREAKERQRANTNLRRAVEEITALLERANDPKLIGRPQVDQLRQAQAELGMKFLQKLLGENRTDPDGPLLTAQVYLALGEAHLIRHEVQAADAYAQALAVLHPLAADGGYQKRSKHAKERIGFAFATAQQEGDRLRGAGQFTDSARAYATACAIAEKCTAQLEPVSTGLRYMHAALWRARLLRMSGQLSEAEKACTKALATAARLVAVYPKNVWIPWCVAQQADACTLRGLSRAEAGRVDQAEKDLRQALALVGKLAPSDQQALRGAHWSEQAAVCHFALGNLLWAMSRKKEARVEFRQAEQRWRGQPSNGPRNAWLAWLLASCPDPEMRKPAEAVKLAKQATMQPRPAGIRPWQVLGVALYRDGDWKAAIGALEKSQQLNQSGDSIDLFFLAMAHGQLGETEKACRYFGQAVQWMEKNKPSAEELRRFRAEAAKLLAIIDQPTPGKKKFPPKRPS
jgi:tRNA A-37 threonylcarbamoyl transferase component Bud32